MVFVDPKNLGYEPFWLRWVANFDENDKKELQALYDKYVPSCISLILEGVMDGRQGEKLKTILAVTNLNLVSCTFITVCVVVVVVVVVVVIIIIIIIHYRLPSCAIC